MNSRFPVHLEVGSAVELRFAVSGLLSAVLSAICGRRKCLSRSGFAMVCLPGLRFQRKSSFEVCGFRVNQKYFVHLQDK